MRQHSLRYLASCVPDPILRLNADFVEMGSQTCLDELNTMPPRTERVVYQRILPPPQPPPPPPIKINVPPSERALQTFAAQQESVLVSLKMYRETMAFSIVKRMVARVGSQVFQSAVFKLPLYPRSIFSLQFAGREGWEMVCNVPEEITDHILPLQQVRKHAAGQSRPVKPPSEVMTRVLAVLTFVSVKSIVSYKPRRECVKVTLMYCLVDEAMEVHGPKNAKRVEIGMEDEDKDRVRQIALTDAMTMAAAGVLFSAAWLARMGPAFANIHQDAAKMEARLALGLPALEEEAEKEDSEDQEDGGSEDESVQAEEEEEEAEEGVEQEAAQELLLLE